MHNVSLEQTYLAGMPNLAYTGLSENWLLKECGHQHWLALAALYDRLLPDFIDPRGRTAYAAFTLVKSQGLQLQAITENRSFRIETVLGRAGQTRHYSEQRLMFGQRCVGTINLMSTFVSRHTPGDNRSVAKACLKGVSPVEATPPAAMQSLHALGKQLRKGDWLKHFEISRTASVPTPAFSFTPCPDVDFNGADFLYFANFQALVERAEWSVLGLRRPGLVRQREIHFHGNLNIGDSVHVQLRTAEADQRTRHWCEIFRQSDGYKLADVFTEKTWPRECTRP
ncbi:Pnap_2097 family protein [Pseudomonas baetica]|uniref:Pnap_2097 family protein n=1 Tax=Pseudomonas baetica TaxID=674054 RepID=UPI00240561F8|nr:Pnap_2097 family protein [Pseudomonas baetica]MDF9773153.1 putative biosynthetic protein (TIGR04099 family) [Pseudomonas baetica]